MSAKNSATTSTPIADCDTDDLVERGLLRGDAGERLDRLIDRQRLASRRRWRDRSRPPRAEAERPVVCTTSACSTPAPARSLGRLAAMHRAPGVERSPQCALAAVAAVMRKPITRTAERAGPSADRHSLAHPLRLQRAVGVDLAPRARPPAGPVGASSYPNSTTGTRSRGPRPERAPQPERCRAPTRSSDARDRSTSSAHRGVIRLRTSESSAVGGVDDQLAALGAIGAGAATRSARRAGRRGRSAASR